MKKIIYKILGIILLILVSIIIFVLIKFGGIKGYVEYADMISGAGNSSCGAIEPDFSQANPSSPTYDPNYMKAFNQMVDKCREGDKKYLLWQPWKLLYMARHDLFNIK